MHLQDPTKAKGAGAADDNGRKPDAPWSKQLTLKPLLTGMSLAALNPALIASWAGLATSVVSAGALSFEQSPPAAFALGVFLGIQTWYALTHFVSITLDQTHSTKFNCFNYSSIIYHVYFGTFLTSSPSVLTLLDHPALPSYTGVLAVVNHYRERLPPWLITRIMRGTGAVLCCVGLVLGASAAMTYLGPAAAPLVVLNAEGLKTTL